MSRSGWYRESTRHSLAARGISTRRYNAKKYSYVKNVKPISEVKLKPIFSGPIGDLNRKIGASVRESFREREKRQARSALHGEDLLKARLKAQHGLIRTPLSEGEEELRKELVEQVGAAQIGTPSYYARQWNVDVGRASKERYEAQRDAANERIKELTERLGREGVGETQKKQIRDEIESKTRTIASLTLDIGKTDLIIKRFNRGDTSIGKDTAFLSKQVKEVEGIVNAGEPLEETSTITAVAPAEYKTNTAQTNQNIQTNQNKNGVDYGFKTPEGNVYVGVSKGDQER